MIVFEIEHEVYLMAGIFLTPSEITETMLHYPRANIDERESLWELLGGIHGMVIADKGLITKMNCFDVQISTYKRRCDLT